MTQKTILCYGDSNTWGYVPNANPNTIYKSRYSRSERWTGVLQELLGKTYYVVEEGLNSRTTNIDYQVPPDRNGKTYLAPCLYSHAPMDLVILALGGNDFKSYFNRKPEDIRDGLADLINIIQSSQYGPGLLEAPKVLITTVPIPLPMTEKMTDENGVVVFEGAIKKAEKLIDLYFELAKATNCHFLNISKDIIPSEIDGGHLDENAHKKLAAMIASKVKEIFV